MAAIDDVRAERARQEELRAAGKFLWTCANRNIPNVRKLTVLSEEIGEVAKEITDLGITEDKYEAINSTTPPHRVKAVQLRVRTELVQVAAVCLAWLEALKSTAQKVNLKCRVRAGLETLENDDLRMAVLTQLQGDIAFCVWADNRKKSQIHHHRLERRLAECANYCMEWADLIDLILDGYLTEK
jgi:hypothetical protein